MNTMRPPEPTSAAILAIAAFGYVLLGGLGLMLALPPGYATPVFPAAGMALAMAIQYGLRIGPVIWLSSATLNCIVAWNNGNLNFGSIAVATAIGFGAMLQAMAGATLIRRFANSDWLRFEQESDAFRFLGLGGLLACAVSASVGVTSLTIAGIVSTDQAAFLWWNWYVGDALGVLLIAPVVIGILNRHRNDWAKRLRGITAPIAAASILAVMAFLASSKWESENLQAKVSEKGESLKALLVTRVTAHREALSALARLLEVTPKLSQSEFDHFTENALAFNPDISALSFNPFVPASKRHSIELSFEHSDAGGNAVIKERDPRGELVPASERPFYVPVSLISPWDKNRQAIGFDIHSEPIRKEALSRALQTRGLVATAPIRLVQNESGHVGMLLLMPVFEYEGARMSKRPAKPAVTGFAVAVVQVDQLVKLALQKSSIVDLQVKVTDITNPSSEKLLYLSHADQGGVVSKALWSSAVQFADREWLIQLNSSSEYLSHNRPWIAWAVGVLGLFFAALLQIMLLAVSGRSALVQRKVLMQTEQINQQKADLEKSMLEAEKANLAKSQFLATMSHELRTPMNGILGMAQLMMTEDLREEDKSRIGTILQSGNALLTILNDILDLSKIEAGKMELSPKPFRPSQLLNEVGALFVEQASRRRIDLLVNWEDAEDLVALGDSARIRQMISNFVSNAIKFTDQGTVRLEGKIAAQLGSRVIIEFSVRDSGIGIEPEKIDALFKPFSQVDGSSTRRFGGTGLGLSIVKSLAESMSGTVGVESNKGVGSRFWFTIQLDIVEKSSTTEIPTGDNANQNLNNDINSASLILVAEDDPTNRLVAQNFLKKLGATAEFVEDGEKAFARSALLKNRPALVLMDVQMPNLDGLGATRKIRAFEAEHGLDRLKIVALTAGAFEEHRTECLQAGMDDFLTKPLQLQELRRCLQQWIPSKN